MRGKIVKGIAGFYYVHAPIEDKIYECKAKGIFRNMNIKPLVGDDVEFDTDDQPEGKGTIHNILPRKNELIRPAVANIDQALVIFAAAEPSPNLNLLDRFLIMMQKQDVPTIICFNKKDIVKGQELETLEDIYRYSGCHVTTASMANKEGISSLQKLLKGKTTVLAGPSGVGKSSFINLIQPEVQMEIGSVSDKIKRGKHTTRHSELIYVEHDTYVMDTPGFSSMFVEDMEKEELKEYFVEFHQYAPECRFLGCMHVKEPSCGVKDAVAEKKINQKRYDNYVLLYNELKDKKRY